ncbi:unnamed protein product [Macrosiphum euphorbiae]|nr:unnamed protein product [Macrosiphum euphorbiae]
MAVVDAHFNFISIDVGSYGRGGDSNVFKECPFGTLLYDEKLNIPEPIILPNINSSPQWPQPYEFVGYETFALHTNLLRAYPGRNLEYLTIGYREQGAQLNVHLEYLPINGVYYIFTSIQVEPDFTDEIVKACCILHNFVSKTDGINYEDSEVKSFDDIETQGGGIRSQGVGVRDYFANYFMGPEAVDFQNKVL